MSIKCSRCSQNVPKVHQNGLCDYCYNINYGALTDLLGIGGQEIVDEIHRERENITELRAEFERSTGTNCTNSQGEPDIDYVYWLEDKISKTGRGNGKKAD